MKAQNCNPGKGVPKKTSKRWVATVSWLCVGVITCAVLFCIYQEATQYNESFHKIKISDRGSIFIDLRLKNIEQLGGKTFAVTEMLVSAKKDKGSRTTYRYSRLQGIQKGEQIQFDRQLRF